MVFLHMVLVCRADDRPVFFEVDLHDTKARGVSRCVMQSDPLEKIQVILVERFPVQIGEVEVVSKVDAAVCSRSDRPASVFELEFVDVDCSD